MLSPLKFFPPLPKTQQPCASGEEIDLPLRCTAVRDIRRTDAPNS